MKELRRLAAERGAHLIIFDPEFEERPDIETKHEKERMQDPHYRRMVAEKVYDHLFRKIKVADVCYIFNKDGYLGANTTGELFAAALAGKICYALENKFQMGHYPHDLYDEPAPQKLVHEVVPTPEELLKRLS
ncbi:MAG: hypothetical protein HYS57_02410 [Parcubacteria group bacterium]|nr:hypothetical protein [Parcubacteria group bacterium]